MEKKSNKGLLVLVIVLSVLVVGLSGYLIYDKLLADDNTTNNENDVVDNKEENIENCRYDYYSNNIYNSDNRLNFSDLTEFDIKDFYNYDGTPPNDKKSYKEKLFFDYYTDGSYGDKSGNKNVYSVTLTLDGKVIISCFTNNIGEMILDVNDIIDIHYFAGEFNGNFSLFMLNDSGDVYYYNLVNLYKNLSDNSVEKINVSNIVRFEEIEFCPFETSGCCHYYTAVTKDEKYIKLDGFCV